MPGLKDAYHRRCIDCHSKSKGPTNCVDCHGKKEKAEAEKGEEEKHVEEKKQIGPDVCTLSNLSKVYQPVKFLHEKHIALIAAKCNKCHHTIKEGEKPIACKECHKAPFKPGKLNVPGLKGAYHRQCIMCHKQMSGPTGCTQCHRKKGDMKK